MGLQGYDLWYVCLRWDRGVINDAVVSPRLWLHDVNCEVGGAPRTELASWVARLVLGRLEEKVQSPIWPRQATPLHLLALMKAVKVPWAKLENYEQGCSLHDLSWNLKSHTCCHFFGPKLIAGQNLVSCILKSRTTCINSGLLANPWECVTVSIDTVLSVWERILGFERCGDHPEWQGPAVYHPTPGPPWPAPTMA